jgi:stage V sporulation protein B
MFPTALSEITEQAVKVGFGLLFANLFKDDVTKAVVFLLLAVSLSELFALFVMLFIYKRTPAPDKNKKEGGMVEVKSILKLSIPVTFSSILLPMSALLDSVLAPRLLGVYVTDAVALYGLFSGGAVTVVNLPVSVCYGIAAASVPAVARASARRTKGDSPKKRIFFSLLITVAVALPSAIGLYLLAEPSAKIIFRSLTEEELFVLTKLIKTFSVSALTLSLVQTLSACLTAQGKPQYAALSMMIAVTVKTGLYVFWLQKASISVFGLAYATNIAYAVAFLLDLVYNLCVCSCGRSNSGI